MIRSAICAALALAAGVLAQEPPSAAPADFPPLVDRCPELGAPPSTFGVDLGPRADSGPGAIPVGNGRVFTHFGTRPRATTLAAVCGPSYGIAPGDPAGVFGDVGLELHDADGRVIALTSGRVRRWSELATVAAEDRGEGFALRVTAFAPPGAPRLVAVVDVVDLGGAGSAGMRLVARVGRPSEPAGDALWITGSDGRAVGQLAIGGGRPTDDGRLVVPLAVAPRGALRTVLEFTAAVDATRLPEPDLAVESAVAAFRAHAAHWRDALAATTGYDTDRRDLADLLTDWKVNLLTQRCAVSGVVVPMLHERRASIRANVGTLLGLLRFGMWDAARAQLDVFRDAVLDTGALPTAVDLPSAPPTDRPDAAPAAGWAAVATPPAGAPSWLLLQHFWYWRATRDDAFLASRWPLLEVLLKKPARGPDGLLPVSGDEAWLDLAVLTADAAAPTLLPAHAPAAGRESASFENGVLFLLAMHAAADMADAIDRHRDPARYAVESPPEGPGARWIRSAFRYATDLERRYWLPAHGHFAPAISPVDDLPHGEALAPANLLPLWVGWTFPSGERSRENLYGTLQRVWRRGARIGSTAALGAAPGDLQARLLVALSERDDARRMEVFDTVVDLARPAGEWARLVDADGHRLAVPGAAFDHLDPGVGGVCVDALVHALTGIRHATVPNWDDDDVRLELRLPRDAGYFTVKGSAKDGRVLDVYVRQTTAPLDAAERAANDDLPAEKRRDPDVAHRRIAFVVDLVEGEPAKGYYDVAINAEGVVFVRYLSSAPSQDGSRANLRRIEETEFAAGDTERFLPAGDSGAIAPRPRAPVPIGDSGVLLVTARTGAPGAASAGRFDVGRPFTSADLAAALFGADDALRCSDVVLDWSHAAPPPWTASAPAVWADPRTANLLATFAARGGRVHRVGFLVTPSVADGTARFGIDPDGALRVAHPGPVTLRFALPAYTAPALLHHGGDGPALIRSGDRELWQVAAGGEAVPDRRTLLLEDAALQHVDVVLPAAGEHRVYLRLTDRDGRPIDG